MHYRCDRTKQIAVVWSCVRKDSDVWISACRSFEVNGVRYRGKGRKTWDEHVKKDLVELILYRE